MPTKTRISVQEQWDGSFNILLDGSTVLGTSKSCEEAAQMQLVAQQSLGEFQFAAISPA